MPTPPRPTRLPARLLPLLVLLLPACTPDAQSPLATGVPLASVNAGIPPVTWYADTGGVGVASNALGEVYTARWDYNPGGDIYLMKRAPNGSQLWEVRYDNTDPTRHEVATWVETDPSGNIFVSGTIRSGYSSPVNANSLLMKFAPDGQLLWRRVYDLPFDGSSTRKLLVDAAGNAYVLGLGTSPAGQRTTVRKFAPDGATVWAWFDPVGVGAPLNFKWTADGGLVIAARGIFGIINGYARLDQNGVTTWTLAGFTSSTTGDAAGDAAGNSYLVNGSTTTSSLLRKVGPTGATIWEQAVPLAGMRVEVGPDQAPIVSGYPTTGSFGAAFAKLSPTGALLWTNLDADGPGVALLAHAQLKLDAAGDAYLAAGTMSQMGVTKVRGSTGAAAWTALIPYGYAQAMAFGPPPILYVVGGTTARIDDPQGPPPPPPPTDADLVLTLADNPDPIRLTGRTTITATAQNAGPASATGVRLVVRLPATLVRTALAASTGLTCTGNRTITCTLATLASGGNAWVAVTARPTARGVVTTTGSVAATQPDPVPGNNSASITTTIRR